MLKVMASDQLAQTRKAFPAEYYFLNAVLPFPGFWECFAAITSAVILTSLLTAEAQSQTTLRGGGPHSRIRCTQDGSPNIIGCIRISRSNMNL